MKKKHWKIFFLVLVVFAFPLEISLLNVANVTQDFVIKVKVILRAVLQS